MLIRRYINLRQAKFIAAAFILSAFRYCVSVWMFCDNASKNLVLQVHKRTLHTVHMLFNHNLRDLLAAHDTVTVHVRNMQMLLCEVYKSLHHDNPSFIWSLFNEKTVPYQLLNSDLLCLPVTNTWWYRLNSMSFKEAFLWIKLPTHYQKSGSIKRFQSLIKN